MLQSPAKLRRKTGCGISAWLEGPVRAYPTAGRHTIAVGRAGSRVLLAGCNALFTETTDVSSKPAVSVAE
jgi:hypothetical protein